MESYRAEEACRIGKGSLWQHEGLDVPDMVQAERFHLSEVILNNPGLPMIF